MPRNFGFIGKVAAMLTGLLHGTANAGPLEALGPQRKPWEPPKHRRRKIVRLGRPYSPPRLSGKRLARVIAACDARHLTVLPKGMRPITRTEAARG